MDYKVNIEAIAKRVQEQHGFNILDNAKRVRYTSYCPQGESYYKVAVEYKDGSMKLWCFKFNSNIFVGDRIDCSCLKNPEYGKIRSALKKDAYTYGTGLRKYVNF